MKKRVKINKDSLEEDAFRQMFKWDKLVKAREYEKANCLCIKYINSCKLVLKNHPWGEANEDYNKVLIFAILFKGLQDFIYLDKTQKSKGWYKDNKKVEYTWIIMHDCQDRIEFVSHNIYENEIIQALLNELLSLKKFFINNFGKGKYLSPDVLIKKSICNICQRDTRACDHIAGRLYNGAICYSVPSDDGIFESVSLVKVPKDPRCRIWSWQILGNTIKDACIMTSFAIDDFLVEGNQKVGAFVSLAINDIERFEIY